jgi:hypothetical protein
VGKQVAMKPTGYEKLRVIVMLCITANGDKLLPYIILNRKTMPKEIFLGRCYSLDPKKGMNDTGITGRLA